MSLCLLYLHISHTTQIEHQESEPTRQFEVKVVQCYDGHVIITVIIVTSQLSRFALSPQARFMLQIREHAITRTIACDLVKMDDAAHCPGNNLPLGQGQACALMLGHGFA
jgi:hypothetical protein